MNRLSLLLISCLTFLVASAQQSADFTLEYASNLSELDSWSDITKFQWKNIDHGVIDNGAEMKRLIELVKDVAPKDTVGFYKQFFDARDNQYIVLRMDQAKAERLFHVRLTSIASTTDPSSNTTKTFSTRDYIYIAPIRGEQQIEIKVWPFGQGEEVAKTITFYGHSYGSRGARSVMLDPSRYVKANYDLQYVQIDDETAKTDTVTISDLQPGKLYTFYDYLLNPIVEAWLRADGFKRMRLNVDKWAEDLVTHFDDGNIGVMTGPQMPFLKHKWLEAPNPSYLDTRLFAPHDTLWVNLFLDGNPVRSTTDLVINTTLLNQDRTPKNNVNMPWGMINGRFYVVTYGDPCAIEAYMKGYAPKVVYSRGAYNPQTGWLYTDEGDMNIYLESTRMPESGVLFSNMELTSLQYLDGQRDDYYLATIAHIDLLNQPVTGQVDYDEYGSRYGKVKYVEGEYLEKLAELDVTFTARSNTMPGDRLYLRKATGAEKNDINVDKLEGDAQKVHFPTFDYSYWTAKFSLINYLDTNKTGRPYLAIDEVKVQTLPILRNFYIDVDDVKKKSSEDAEKQTQPDPEAEKKGTDHLDAFTALNFSFKFPMAPPPVYFRLGLDVDFIKKKKVAMFQAIGVGIDFDFLDADGATAKWKDGYNGLGPNNRVGKFDKDKINIRSTDENDFRRDSKSKDFFDKFDDNAKDPDMLVAKASVSLELYNQFSIPLWHWNAKDFLGLRFLDEVSINGRANLNLAARLSLLDFASWAAGKIGHGQAQIESMKNNKTFKKIFKALDSGLELNFQTLVTLNAGMFYFDDGNSYMNPLQSHIFAANFQAKVDAALRLGLKIDAIAFGGEAGVLGAAGVYIKGSAGDRMMFDRPFEGVAWSWRAAFGLYYRAHLLSWTWRDELMFGNLDYKPAMLIGNQTNTNPFHKDFKKYMATGKKSKLPARVRQLPGNTVTSGADAIFPIRFLSGGDSIVYKTDATSPNKRYLRVASTGSPTVISDYNKGGAADFHSASSPNFDMVVFEQAKKKFSDAEAAPSNEELVDCIIRNGDDFSIYYAMKKVGGKWYSPKPIDPDSRNTCIKPRVAIDENGNAVAIWQDGYQIRDYQLSLEEQQDISNLIFNGYLVISRFNGTEWTKPVNVIRVDRRQKLSDYQLTVKDGEVFIAAVQILPDDTMKPVFIHVSADNNVTVTDAPMANNSWFELRRVGNHNVLAQMLDLGESEHNLRIAVNSYDMKGKPDGQLNCEVNIGDNGISKFHLLTDQKANSLNNIGLMWLQTSPSGEEESYNNMLKAARLVPNGINMNLGTPLVLAEVGEQNQVYDFDGYMTDEKINGCYIVNDATSGTVINRVTGNFENAFSYTILFDRIDNQAITSSAEDNAQTTFLVEVNNLGTSAINYCELNVEGEPNPIPLHLVVPPGGSSRERVSIPFRSGQTINTTLTVTYEDVLGLQEKQLPRFLERRKKRAHARRNGMTYTDEYSHEDVIYEQSTTELYPDIPIVECYALNQTIDEDGTNRIVVRIKNTHKRQMPQAYTVILQAGDEAESMNFNEETTKGFVFAQDEAFRQVITSLDPEYVQGIGVFQQRNGYEMEDIVIKIPKVTETKPLYLRAVVRGFDENFNFIPLTGGNKGQEFAIVMLYPSNVPTAVENIYEEGDSNASLHIQVNGNQVDVDGAQPGEDVRLYLSNGLILARQKASAEGKATFNMPPVRRGVYLLSNKNETVKFNF